MSAISSITRLVSGLAEALGSSARAVTSEAGFQEVAVALGWNLDAMPGPLGRRPSPAALSRRR